MTSEFDSPHRQQELDETFLAIIATRDQPELRETKLDGLLELADVGHMQALSEAEAMVRTSAKKYHTTGMVTRDSLEWERLEVKEKAMVRVAGAIATNRNFEDAFMLACDITNDPIARAQAFLSIGLNTGETQHRVTSFGLALATLRLPDTGGIFGETTPIIDKIVNHTVEVGDIETFEQLWPSIKSTRLKWRHNDLEYYEREKREAYLRHRAGAALNANSLAVEEVDEMIDDLLVEYPDSAYEVLFVQAEKGNEYAAEKIIQTTIEEMIGRNAINGSNRLARAMRIKTLPVGAS